MNSGLLGIRPAPFGFGRLLSGPLAEGPLGLAALAKAPQPPLCGYCKGAGAPVMTIVRMNSKLRRQPVISDQLSDFGAFE